MARLLALAASSVALLVSASASSMTSRMIENSNADILASSRGSRAGSQEGREREAVLADTLYAPGTPAPAFSFTLNNGTTISYTPGSGSSPLFPLIVHAWRREDGFASIMWSDATNSLDVFLAQASTNISYLFLSWNSDPNGAAEDVAYLQSSIYARLFSIGLSPDRISAWQSHLLFCPTPISALSSTWIPNMLGNWTSPMEGIFVPSTGANVTRADSHYAWLPWPEAGSNATLVVGGDACAPAPPSPATTFNNSIALVTWAGQDAQCDFAEAIYAAQTAGASGVVIIQSAGTTVVDMNCVGEVECGTLAVGIQASMVTNENGALLLAAAAPAGAAGVPFTYIETQTPGYYFGIDEVGNLFEMGWLKVPTAMFLGWQGQYQEYLIELRGNLTRPALEVPIFNFTLMQGAPGATVNVTLPPYSSLTSSYNVMELEAALSCPTPWDYSCAIWDRTVTLTICCGSESSSNPFCGTEIGRWISNFRRGVGRWVTDVTPLFPLLSSPTTPPSSPLTCNFTMATDSWAMPWYVSATLRFRNSTGEGEDGTDPSVILRNRGLRPLSIEKLWSPGATFDANFSTHFPTRSVSTPVGAKAGLLYSVITGHGSDNNGCGEFCVTENTYTLAASSTSAPFNATEVFREAGTPWGSAEIVRQGVVPNQHGTWAYGRDGWQDGQKVRPWLIDVSTAIAPVGGNTNVSYECLYAWQQPDPTSSPGYIIHTSYMTYWG